MKRNRHFLISGLFSLILISFHCMIAANSFLVMNNLEWKVNIGDSITYMYKDFYDIRQTNPFQFSLSGIDVNGELVSANVKKGTILTYTITLRPTTDSVIGRTTYNLNVTFEERPIPDIILIKTVNSKSYWENYYSKNESFSIQGDLLIQTTSSFDVHYEEGQAFPYELTTIFKWDWKTGWLTFFHIRSNSYEDEVYYEEKFEAIPGFKSANGQLQSNATFGVVFLGIIIIIFLTEKKIIKRDK